MTVASAIQDYLNERPSDEELSSLELRSPLVGGQNRKFHAVTRSAIWLVKFCRNNHGRVPEICEREALISLLGRILGVSVVSAWVIPMSRLTITAPIQNADADIILDRIVLMNLIYGQTVDQNQLAAAEWINTNAHFVADIFAFMHWIGDEDRSLTDIMIDSNGLVLIDNGLCGPGESDKLRGYHPTPEVYTSDRILLKCYGGKRSFVEFVLKRTRADEAQLQSPRIISKIFELTVDELMGIARCVNIGESFAEILYERGKTLRNDYSKWFHEAVSFCRNQNPA